MEMPGTVGEGLEGAEDFGVGGEGEEGGAGGLVDEPMVGVGLVDGDDEAVVAELEAALPAWLALPGALGEAVEECSGDGAGEGLVEVKGVAFGGAVAVFVEVEVGLVVAVGEEAVGHDDGHAVAE